VGVDSQGYTECSGQTEIGEFDDSFRINEQILRPGDEKLSMNIADVLPHHYFKSR
jgi:hypothetical protein